MEQKLPREGSFEGAVGPQSHGWIHSLCLVHLCTQIRIWEGADRRPRGCWVPQGRSSTWETSVSPARDNSTVTLGSGHPEVTVLCVLPDPSLPSLPG